MSRREKRPWIVGAIVVVALLAPMVRDKDADSYPLSNYPMFTADQPREATFVRAVSVDVDGGERVLPPEVAGGTVEVIHANRTLRAAVREDRAAEMCAEIAERVAASADASTVVLIVSDRLESVDVLRRDNPPILERTVHANCRVDGGER